MQIKKPVQDYCILSGDNVLDALKRINHNQSRIVFVIEENGTLIGSLSDGDIRRWLVANPNFDLDQQVDQIMNRHFVSRPVSDPPNQLESYFSDRISLIPLTDDIGRFVALAIQNKDQFEIGSFSISDDRPTFVVAEVGNNHNGDINLAKQLVDLAIESGADCVKFQMRDLNSLYTNQGRSGEANYDLGSQYTLDLLNKFQLNADQLFEVFDYCNRQGILPLCTPWDLASIRLLHDFGIQGFKVASADLTNHELLEHLAATGKPLICSTGMSTESEIRSAVDLLKKRGGRFALLHCNSTYPSPFKDVNLKYIPRLKELAHGAPVGYSGHERGYAVPLAAIPLGARIIEKHFTIDRGMEGNDHKVSLLPSEFAEMVRQIRNVEQALGNADERRLSQGEMINRENLAKSLVINRDVAKGETIRRAMITIQSPGQGLQPNRLDEIVDRPALRDLNAGDVLFESDLAASKGRKAKYIFNRPYGIPVRYHDFESLTTGIALDFVEFHLSYHDLTVAPSEYLRQRNDMGYAVHCPELFAGDHILDLANSNQTYRDRSIVELKRTIHATEELNQYFPTQKKPVMVLNAGGWSVNGFCHEKLKKDMYLTVEASLQAVDLSRIQLAIQTMPPFPWHFGGQSYHNLFVDPDEIVDFCSRSGHQICLDISHSMMACNYYGWDFKLFLEKVLPFTAHLHVVDALGVDGEGVQMGKGDVDFGMLKEELRIHAPHIQFIPEVWQGHKDKGQGFWDALAFLEELGI